MSGHTKGPWAYNERHCALAGPDGARVRFYGDGIAIAMSAPTAEERANYRLMVAAPELLEALKDIAYMYAQYVGENTVSIILARRAIAKAEGK